MVPRKTWVLENFGRISKSQSVFDKSQNLVFAWFVYTFFESRNFLPKSLGLGFLTRISASLGFYHLPPQDVTDIYVLLD